MPYLYFFHSIWVFGEFYPKTCIKSNQLFVTVKSSGTPTIKEIIQNTSWSNIYMESRAKPPLTEQRMFYHLSNALQAWR